MRQVIFDQVFRYIKIRGICVGSLLQLWGMSGDGSNLHGVPRKDLSSGVFPTQIFFRVGIAWGGFAWASETGV